MSYFKRILRVSGNHLFFLAFLIISVHAASAQQNNIDLHTFNQQREQLSRNGMYVLGGWAAANIAVSGVEYYHTSGTEKYFHQMNVIWNGVNFVLAGGSLLAKNKKELNLNQSFRTQNSMEKIFLANACLDLLYSSAGLYLTERSKSANSNRDKLYGWGESLVLQGGFLFLFDSTMCILHTRHGKKGLWPALNKIDVTTSGLGLKVGISL